MRLGGKSLFFADSQNILGGKRLGGKSLFGGEKIYFSPVSPPNWGGKDNTEARYNYIIILVQNSPCSLRNTELT